MRAEADAEACAERTRFAGRHASQLTIRSCSRPGEDRPATRLAPSTSFSDLSAASARSFEMNCMNRLATRRPTRRTRAAGGTRRPRAARTVPRGRVGAGGQRRDGACHELVVGMQVAGRHVPSVRFIQPRRHPVLANRQGAAAEAQHPFPALGKPLAAPRKPGCMIRAFDFRPALGRLQKGSRSHFFPPERGRRLRLRSSRAFMEERAVHEPDFAPFARLQRSPGPAGLQQEAGF